MASSRSIFIVREAPLSSMPRGREITADEARGIVNRYHPSPAASRSVSNEPQANLQSMADRHAQANRIRALAAAVEQSGELPESVSGPTELREWLKWARDAANELDPLTQ